MKITVLGIDLAKSVFQLHGVDSTGKTVLRKKLSRGQLLTFIANTPACLIGMEACSGSNYWAREFQKLGHQVRLMSPQFVKPYVKSNKNDAADAEAICEAVQRPTMRFVTGKQIEQQDIQCLHRVRDRLVRSRTALANEIRGLLLEYGIVIPKSLSKLRSGFPIMLEDHADQLTSMSSDFFAHLLKEFRSIDERIAVYDDKIKAVFQAHPVCKRLAQIPGIGPLTATVLVAAVADPASFKNGRQFAAWLGLVPRQHSSGGKERLLGISKRGDSYLRMLLIHGARATLRWVDPKEDRRSRWAKQLIERRGKNRAAVALANKNARTVWALLARGEEYQEAA
jgi:transposase